MWVITKMKLQNYRNIKGGIRIVYQIYRYYLRVDWPAIPVTVIEPACLVAFQPSLSRKLATAGPITLTRLLEWFPCPVIITKGRDGVTSESEY